MSARGPSVASIAGLGCITLLLLGGIITAIVVGVAQRAQLDLSPGGGITPPPPPGETILALLGDNPILSRLAEAIALAELESVFSGDAPVTVLAPTDAAFAALSNEVKEQLESDPDLLQAVLLYHVVSGVAPTSAFTNDQLVSTVQGEVIEVTVDGGLAFNGAGLVEADIVASNGIVHIIDAVLLPPSFDIGVPPLVCGDFANVPDPEEPQVQPCTPVTGTCNEANQCVLGTRALRDDTLSDNRDDDDELLCPPDSGVNCAEIGSGNSCECGVQTCTRSFFGSEFVFECVPDDDDDDVIVIGDDDDLVVVLVAELQQLEADLESRGTSLRRVQATPRLSWRSFARNQQGSAGAVVELRQADFDSGTLRVLAPCTLVLAEDVEFRPNADADFRPTDAQRGSGEYPRASGFELDFFAAIMIGTDDVLLDLNGHELRSSREWHTKQSFGMLISISTTPFISGEGPAKFGDRHYAPNRIVIRNGRLGFNQHHGIHGNAGKDIYLHDLEIDNFHIAGIALNGVENVVIDNVRIRDTNVDLAVTGAFSQVRFLQRFLARAAPLHAPSAAALATLERLEREAFDDVVANNVIDAVAHPDAHRLFDNAARMVDGNAYGLVITNRGTGAPQFDTEYNEAGASYRVLVRDVTIENIRNAIVETVVLLDENNQAIVGPAGDVLMFDKSLTANAVDELLDAQLAFAAAYREFGTPIWHAGTLNVPDALVDWYEDGAAVAELGALIAANDWRWARNTDPMFHNNKGATGVRVDSCRHAKFVRVSVDGVEAHGAPGDEFVRPGEVGPIDAATYSAFDFGHPDQAPRLGYCGNCARGALLSASIDIDMQDLQISGVASTSGGPTFVVDTMADRVGQARRITLPPGALAQGGQGKGNGHATDAPTPVPTPPPASGLTADVMVGGAGYAGVSLANQLQARGVTFRLLEAADYVGGRMVCKEYGENPATGEPYCLEAGANWVQGLNGNPVWCEALKYGLEGNAQNFDDITYYRADGTPDDANALYNRGSACEREFVAYVEAGAISARCLQPGSDQNPPKKSDRDFCGALFGAPFEFSDDDDISNDRGQRLSSVAFDPITDPEQAEARACDVYSQDFEWAQFPNITSLNMTLPANTYNSFRDADYWVGGGSLGYSRLPKKLLAEFVATSVNSATEVVFDDPDKLALQTKVLEVHWDPTGVAPVETLVCDTEKVALADEPVRWPCVAGTERTLTSNEFVSTFSLGVLQASIGEELDGVPLAGSRDVAPRFSPPLSSVPALASSIGQYPMAQYSKIFFRFAHKFWDDAQLTISAYSEGRWVGEFGAVWQSLDVGGNPNRFLPGSKIFFVTALGERAIDLHQKTDAQVRAEFIPQLNQMFPERIEAAYGRPLEAGDVLEFSMTRWIEDPLTRGMYSNMAVNRSWAEIEPTRQRYGNLMFSGEHTCFRFNGYTHGALLGGKRSAGILLAERYGFADADDEQSICDVADADVDPCAQGYVPKGQSNGRAGGAHRRLHKRQVANGGKGNNYNPPGHVHPARGVKRDTDLTDDEIDVQMAAMGQTRHRTA